MSIPQPRVVQQLMRRGWAVGHDSEWRAAVRAECRAAGLRVTTSKAMYSAPPEVPMCVAVATDTVPDAETSIDLAWRTGQHWCAAWQIGLDSRTAFGPIIWHPTYYRFCPYCGVPLPTQQDVQERIDAEFPADETLTLSRFR